MKKSTIIVAGHVGHGRNTLVGRLLYETGFVSEDISGIINDSETADHKNNFVSTAEQPTRQDEADIPRIEFKTPRRNYSFIIPTDHEAFLRHMVTGTIEADVAILVIDPSHGLLDQTCQYAYLLAMFGIKEIIIVINKMDIKYNNRVRFWEISEEATELLKKLNVHVIDIIPTSAQYGDNITAKSSKMDWNTSVPLMKSLDYFSAASNLTQLPLRLIVQSSFLIDGKTKILAKVISGKLFKDHQLTFGPTYQTTRVLSIEIANQQRTSANSGESVVLTLEDIKYLERGQVGFNVCHPPLTTDFLIAKVFWLGVDSLKPTDKIDILCGTQRCRGHVEKIMDIINPISPDIDCSRFDQLAESQIANIGIKLDFPICIDLFDKLPGLGKFGLLQDNRIVGGGTFR